MSAERDTFPKTLVIIPAYNEENTVVQVAEAAMALHPDIDVLVVNDKSTDATEQVLRENHIQFVSLPTNLGIGGAVQTGFLFAVRNDYEVAVQVDGDGQHPPEKITQLLQPIAAGQADFVIGSRYLIANHIVSSKARRLGGGLLATVIRLATGQKVTDPTSGFRAFNKKAFTLLSRWYPQEYPEPISVLELIDHGFTLVEVPLEMKKRAYGRSSIVGADTVFYMIKVIFALIIAKLRGRSLS